MTTRYDYNGRIASISLMRCDTLQCQQTARDTRMRLRLMDTIVDIVIVIEIVIELDIEIAE